MQEGEAGNSPSELSIQCILMALQQRVFNNANC